jgi:diguanylate cyclase (GGDEF)-like protein/PAS domain S-box-containing protein
VKVSVKNKTILFDAFKYTNAVYILFFCITLAIICLAAMFIILHMKIKSEKRIAEAALELSQITNSIHAGFLNFILNNNYEIIYASKGYYDIIGYSKEEVQKEYENSAISFVFQEDRDKFNILSEGLNNGDYIQKEVRLITKEGKKIWILLNGNYSVDKNDNHMISAVLVDITESKQMHERLLLEEERYRVATEISNDILFEYDIDEDLMKFVDKYRDLYGRNPVISNFSTQSVQNGDMVHSEDVGIFFEYCRALSSGKEMIESEFRLRDVKDEYVWCHTRGKTLYDDNKHPIKVIGKIVNIDLHKKELQTLEYKAKRDPLTGVYNKVTTKDLIDHFILKHCDNQHIFMIVDIDDFKKINDQYGHLQGDKILSFVISQVRLIFTAGEIIGRIGGDEFAVFVGDMGNIETMVMKVNLLQRALRTVYREDEYEISVSGSIGISMYPKDGSTYNELLNCADKALYDVKEQGKDGYKLFT